MEEELVHMKQVGVLLMTLRVVEFFRTFIIKGDIKITYKKKIIIWSAIKT